MRTLNIKPIWDPKALRRLLAGTHLTGTETRAGSLSVAQMKLVFLVLSWNSKTSKKKAVDGVGLRLDVFFLLVKT